MKLYLMLLFGLFIQIYANIRNNLHPRLKRQNYSLNPSNYFGQALLYPQFNSDFYHRQKAEQNANLQIPNQNNQKPSLPLFSEPQTYLGPKYPDNQRILGPIWPESVNIQQPRNLYYGRDSDSSNQAEAPLDRSPPTTEAPYNPNNVLRYDYRAQRPYYYITQSG